MYPMRSRGRRLKIPTPRGVSTEFEGTLQAEVSSDAILTEIRVYQSGREETNGLPGEMQLTSSELYADHLALK